jgi:ribonuclease D
MTEPFKLINNEQALLQLCEELNGSKWLAVDTEFERVSTYYPELCLVQISNGEITAVVDPLVIEDITPLLDLLYQPLITKVLHSAHQDLEIFFNIKGTVPTPLFDTQLAAPLLGYAVGIGYGNLINEALNIELDKGHARADWKMRPLTDDMLRYAADDVIYLGKVYELFIEKLVKIDNESLLTEKLARLVKEETYKPNPGLMWKKIFAAKKMKGKQLAVVKQLAAWREMTARDRNRPRKWIIPDHSLIQIAIQLPENKTQLLSIDKVGEKTVSRHGDDLLKICHDAN